jgi:hypothetical protein
MTHVIFGTGPVGPALMEELVPATMEWFRANPK